MTPYAVAAGSRQPIALALAPVLFVLGAWAMLVPNTGLLLLALGVLASSLLLLNSRGFPPVLAFVFGYQWLQSSAKLFQAAGAGAPIDAYTNFVGDMSTATALSLLGLLALVIGMWLGLGAGPPPRRTSEDGQVESRPPLFWLGSYVAATAAALVLQAASARAGGLSQLLLAAAGVKWAFFTLFTQSTFRSSSGLRLPWLAVFGVELALGTVGFFSDFRQVLFFTVFGLMASGLRLSAARVAGLLLMGALALTLAVGWTAVKMEQRKFLTAGERTQVVSATRGESMGNLLQLVGDLDRQAMESAVGKLVDRIAYTDYFGRVLDNVPAVLPHEHGGILIDAVRRPLMPRLLFPDKAVIDDTERSVLYAGLQHGPFYAGTSISLGYMAEAYIDFGRWLMFAPVLVLGWCLGSIYRRLSRLSYVSGDMGAALASAVLLQAAYLETSITKLVGGLAVGLLASWAVARFVMPPVLRQWPARRTGAARSA